jgi:hypothetical protein
MTLTSSNGKGLVKCKDLLLCLQVLTLPSFDDGVFNRVSFIKEEVMKNIKGTSDALIPLLILLGLIGVEIMSAATQYVAVAGLIIILIIQTICYAYNKIN